MLDVDVTGYKPELDIRNHGKNVLSMDPGKDNFAYTIWNISYDAVGDEPHIIPIKSGQFGDTVKDIRAHALQDDCKTFITQIDDLISDLTERTGHGLTAVCAERYLEQGKLVGKTNEVCNISLGYLCYHISLKYPDVKLVYVRAVDWKTAFKRAGKPNVIHKKDYLLDCYALCGTTEHQLDSLLLGIYCLNRWVLDDKQPFAHFSSEEFRDKLLARLEYSSVYKLTKRRCKREYYTNGWIT